MWQELAAAAVRAFCRRMAQVDPLGPGYRTLAVDRPHPVVAGRHVAGQRPRQVDLAVRDRERQVAVTGVHTVRGRGRPGEGDAGGAAGGLDRDLAEPLDDAWRLDDARPFALVEIGR